MMAMMPGSPSDLLEMSLMGLQTSVIAPAVYLASRRRLRWDAIALPASAALPVFIAGHTVITVWMAFHMPTWSIDWIYQVSLLVLSIVFWLPVIGTRHRLGPGGRMIYLFAAMPAMDMAGVFVVLHGDAAGGLAMIVAMLPVGVAAVASTWRWIVAEQAIEVSAPVGRPVALAEPVRPNDYAFGEPRAGARQ